MVLAMLPMELIPMLMELVLLPPMLPWDTLSPTPQLELPTPPMSVSAPTISELRF